MEGAKTLTAESPGKYNFYYFLCYVLLFFINICFYFYLVFKFFYISVLLLCSVFFPCFFLSFVLFCFYVILSFLCVLFSLPFLSVCNLLLFLFLFLLVWFLMVWFRFGFIWFSWFLFFCFCFLFCMCLCVCFCLVLLLPFAWGFVCLFSFVFFSTNFFCFLFFSFLPSHVACGVLVPRPQVGPEPLGWQCQVQDARTPENSWPQGILLGESSWRSPSQLQDLDPSNCQQAPVLNTPHHTTGKTGIQTHPSVDRLPKVVLSTQTPQNTSAIAHQR